MCKFTASRDVSKHVLMVTVMAIAVLSRSKVAGSLGKHPVVAKVAATASLLSPLL